MKYFLKLLSNKNIHTEKIALVRATLAIGTLIALLSNDISLLTHTQYVYSSDAADTLNDKLLFHQISIFNIFPVTLGKLTAILILLSVISGYLPRITSLLHLWVNLSITNTIIAIDGGDQIAANLAFLLVPICVTDPRINQWSVPTFHNRPSINIFTNVTLFFIQLQAAIIYLNAGIGKLYAGEWKEGTAVFYWFSHATLGAPDWLRNIYEIATLSDWVALLSWGVVIFEVGLFACIFASKRVKTIFLVLALVFHFLIIFTHGLLSFFFSMAALLIIYLDDANNSITVLNRLKGKIKSKHALFGKFRFHVKNYY